MLKLHNTLTRKVEDFKPLNSEQVTIYTCGPTVYDYLHIGNWVSYIRWDTLVRVLLADGYKVKRVMNITDVGHLVSDADEGEDKLEKGARREGKTAWEIADHYTKDFFSGVNKLNLIEPAVYAKATEHIDSQISLIKQLEQKGFTYKIIDGVYFDTTKFPTYADFAKLNIKEQKEGTRLAVNPEKHHPQDFALWKFSPANQKRDMQWDSPWGVGFPGWHLECSAMAMEYLGKTIDIHTGGIDHIPVHHTNEIAQSEAATGQRFVNYWLHNNFLMVDGSKIAKSLQNGITLQKLASKQFSPLDFKMFVHLSHYRSEVNFTWTALTAAQTALNNWYAWTDLIFQSSGPAKTDIDQANQLYSQVMAAINNDLNTPEAVAVVNQAIDKFAPTKELVDKLEKIFGLRLNARKDITQDQKDLIKEREHSRINGDWAKSDQYREELYKQGLKVSDTPTGPVWSRI